jgi:hypothetical protein
MNADHRTGQETATLKLPQSHAMPPAKPGNGEQGSVMANPASFVETHSGPTATITGNPACSSPEETGRSGQRSKR